MFRAYQTRGEQNKEEREDNLIRGDINCENVNLTAVTYSPSDLTVENSKLMRIKRMTVIKTLLLSISIDYIFI